MTDPLHWWPGKYADCKRIAHLVAESLPRGDVLVYGSLRLFSELLPRHHVTTARASDGARLCKLRCEDEAYDVGVSARVVELLPPALRPAYLRELLRACRYHVFLALPLQPELEAIDKVKNTYIWGTTRVWQHLGLRPQDLDELLEAQDVSVTYHVDAPSAAELAAPEASREMMRAMLLASSPRGSELVPGLQPPAFVIAEITKNHVLPAMVTALAHEAH